MYMYMKEDSFSLLKTKQPNMGYYEDSVTDDTGRTHVEEGSHLKSGRNRRNRSQAGCFHSLLKKPIK